LSSSGGSSSLESQWIAIVFLVFAGLLEVLVTLFAGSPIAQSPGELRTWGLVCCLLAGFLGTSYWAVMRPAFEFDSRMGLAMFVSAYAFLQVVPLPIALMRILSPARASLASALQPVTLASRWAPSWAPISAMPSATLYHSLLFCACTSVFLVTFDLSRRFALRAWIVTLPLILVGAAQAVIGLMQASSGPDSIATGTFSIRNHYAGFLEMVLPFAATLLFVNATSLVPGDSCEARPSRVIAAVSFAGIGVVVAALGFAAILSSLSRMGFIASLASMAFIVIAALGRRIPSRRLPLAAAMVVMTAAVLTFLLPSARLVSRFAEVEERGSDRLPVWRDTVRLIRAYPVFGCGLGAYESAFLEFKRTSPELNQDYAHNDYLQYLAEMGAVGFALLMLPLSAIILRLRFAALHPRPDIRWLGLACAGSMLAIGLHSFVDFNLYIPANMFTFAWILGISAAIGQQARRSEVLSPWPVLPNQRGLADPGSSVDPVIEAL
jgi:O-antigen ligase